MSSLNSAARAGGVDPFKVYLAQKDETKRNIKLPSDQIASEARGSAFVKNDHLADKASNTFSKPDKSQSLSLVDPTEVNTSQMSNKLSSTRDMIKGNSTEILNKLNEEPVMAESEQLAESVKEVFANIDLKDCDIYANEDVIVYMGRGFSINFSNGKIIFDFQGMLKEKNERANSPMHKRSERVEQLRASMTAQSSTEKVMEEFLSNKLKEADSARAEKAKEIKDGKLSAKVPESAKLGASELSKAYENNNAEQTLSMLS